MKNLLLLLGAVLSAMGMQAADLKAAFSAEEAAVAYYEMGWDSEEEMQTWDYSSTASGKYTWYLSNTVTYRGQQPFSSIDPKSKYSLCVNYSNSSTQNEVAASPVIAVRPHSVVEFYACFSSAFLVYNPWKFFVIDEDAEKVALEFNAFEWSQENGFEGPAWQKFSFDLSELAGKNVSLAFQYLGPDGEDLVVDGLRVYQLDDDADAVITVNEGASVHFVDRSEGAPDAWTWQFEGGAPATSSERNPVVAYDKAGDYRVSLTVTQGGASDVAVRNAYVHVVPQAATALIGLPAEGYQSPWCASFVPLNTPVQFTDLSSGKPTSWLWHFDGGTPEESAEQNPVVVYKEEGLYGLTLDVENAVGTSHDFMVKAIQAGGTQYVWNIAPEETGSLDEVAMGWYGYYGGTNWLGMKQFAEKFDKPAVPVVIDKVQAYFNRTSTVTPDAPITVSICSVGSDGLPADVLVSATVLAKDLAYDAHEVVPTDFEFDAPVTLEDAFFVVIGGFPNNTDADTHEADDISLLCIRRAAGEKCTAYHLLEEEDPVTYEPTGEYKWYLNADDPVSFAITPQLCYLSPEVDRLATVKVTTDHLPLVRYNVSGQQVGDSHRGIQLQRMGNGKVRKVVVK